MPIKPHMTSPKIICFSDSHYHQAIFSLDPYIADCPEQCSLVSVVQGWYPQYVNNRCYVTLAYSLSYLLRCTVLKENIDGGQFIPCSEAHSELLCKTLEVQELWDDYGIIGQVKVSISPHTLGSVA